MLFFAGWKTKRHLDNVLTASYQQLSVKCRSSLGLSKAVSVNIKNQGDLRTCIQNLTIHSLKATPVSMNKFTKKALCAINSLS